MDKFLIHDNSSSSSSGGARRRRARDDDDDDEPKQVVNGSASAANKRAKPRHKSRLSLPEKRPGGNPARVTQATLRRPSTDPVCTPLRDRLLNAPPVAPRQLGGLGNIRNHNGDSLHTAQPRGVQETTTKAAPATAAIDSAAGSATVSSHPMTTPRTDRAAGSATASLHPMTTPRTSRDSINGGGDLDSRRARPTQELRRSSSDASVSKRGTSTGSDNNATATAAPRTATPAATGRPVLHSVHRPDRMTAYFPRAGCGTVSTKRRPPMCSASRGNGHLFDPISDGDGEHSSGSGEKDCGSGSDDCFDHRRRGGIDEDEEEEDEEQDIPRPSGRSHHRRCHPLPLQQRANGAVSSSRISNTTQNASASFAELSLLNPGHTLALPAPSPDHATIAGIVEEKEPDAEARPVVSATAVAKVSSTAAELWDAISAVEATEMAATNAPEPARRRNGMSALFLTERRSTGGRGRGLGDAGKDAFRRRALATVFAGGVTAVPLKMGRVSGSRVGGGVVRGDPQGRDGQRRSGAGGVMCLEFDSMGALLLVGGVDSVSVYDFDEFLPQISRVKPVRSGEVSAYLQPTHCIQTRRAVSCVRWNPANENQIAISFLHYDEIQIFDLESILPNVDATPVLTLVPAGGSSTAGGTRATSNARFTGATIVRGDGLSRAGSIGGGLRGGGTGVGGGGGSRGLGHSCFEFVLRKGLAQGSRMVTHVVGGGRGGVFRAWRLSPTPLSGQIAPYLQVLPTANPRGGAFTGWIKPCADVTAVCCITPDVAIIGTDAGTLATFSLHPPTVKAFGSGKSADRLGQWSLGDPRIWGGVMFPESYRASAFRISSLRCSADHAGPWVVTCGLRSGRVVVFDTRAGRALGITAPDATPPSSLFCQPGAGGAWGDAVVSCPVCPDGEGQEIRLLATSARAGLDENRKGGRDSSLRPGPGWALGEAGGGGFRVEESDGYNICLPMEVERATPGQSGVVLPRDARAYICPRAETRLLRSRMVTSSVMIGDEEYTVEAMGRDGTTLVLDRRYQGLRVRDGEVSSSPEIAPVAAAAGGAHVRSTEIEDAGQPNPDSEGSDELEVALRDYVGEAPLSSAAESNVTVTEVSSDVAAEDAVASAVSNRRSKGASVGLDDDTTGQPRGANSGAYGSPLVTAASDTQASSRPCWHRSWRPTRVRIFAKLEAIFDGGGGGASPTTQPSPHLGVQYPWENAELSSADELNRRTTIESASWMLEGENNSAKATGASSASTATAGSWSALQVVTRARLGLDLLATAMTCHPDMNFVLMGLEDGTVAAILPGKKTKRKKTPTES